MSEEGEKKVQVLFDVGHNEVLDITMEKYEDFKEFLKSNNFDIWQMDQRPLTYELLSDYQILVIGGPKGAKFEEGEVVAIIRYLRQGGALVLLNQGGGDQHNSTNLNLIASNLGFQFNGDYMAHETDFENNDFYQTITRGIAMHQLTIGTRSIMSGYTCTIDIKDPSGAEALVFSHEPWPESRNIVVNGYYGMGRYFAGCTSLVEFCGHHDNQFLLHSLFFWLSQERAQDTMF